MKQIITSILLLGFIMSIQGCEGKEEKLQAEKKSKRVQMKQKINAKSNNEPTKLPL